MKKYIVTFSFLIIAGVGFSQTTKVETKKEIASTTKSNNKIKETSAAKAVVKPKNKVLDEGTNDPLLSGYTKTMVNGKEVYVKQNSKIKMTYEPK
jgi:hypothetical protein